MSDVWCEKHEIEIINRCPDCIEEKLEFDKKRLDKLERWLEEADGDNQFTYEAGNAEGGDGFFLEEGLEIISSAKNLREAIDKLENF